MWPSLPWHRPVLQQPRVTWHPPEHGRWAQGGGDGRLRALVWNVSWSVHGGMHASDEVRKWVVCTDDENFIEDHRA